jgi:LmbE family N-acetylglucosaminyl deacetylase
VTDNEYVVERVLVVVAHPDDVDFGCAGTMATWTDAGLEVSYCIVTDGDAGGFDPAVPRHEIGGIRQDEQRAAAKAVGVEDVTFLGYPDGRLAEAFKVIVPR